LHAAAVFTEPCINRGQPPPTAVALACFGPYTLPLPISTGSAFVMSSAASTPHSQAGSASGLRPVNPPGWAQPKGYANGITGRGRLVFVAGQIGWNEAQIFTTDDFVGQLEQALRNTVAVLAAAGARPEHIARMTWYVTDKREYLASLPAIGRAWREILGRHFPAMALVQVVALIEDRAKIEIETTALVPDESSDR
jgi:enamine deaminase RidA (YjgF/YER057c/UK114 family)